MITAILAITLVLESAAFLFYLNKRDKRDMHERWQYEERIRQPNKPQAPPRVFEKPPKVKIQDLKPKDEFDLVGEIDPPTPLRTDNASGP